jgi:hypothetical protein
MSYACEMVSGCVIWKVGWGTNPTLHRVVQDFERLLDLVGELGESTSKEGSGVQCHLTEHS